VFVGLSVAPAPALRQHGSRLSKAYNNNLNEDMGMDKSRQPSGAPMHARIWLSTTQDGTEAGTPDAGGSNPSAGSHQPLVLLVEDNHINQVVALEFLALMGVQARLARNGIEALSACADTAPDLVLMDIQMPGMDGLECARRLRAQQREGKLPSFPILALTAHALDADVAASLEAGMDEHLTKPLDFVALRTRLQRWLKLPEPN
jgi:CheY-like chemotaxis protein